MRKTFNILFTLVSLVSLSLLSSCGDDESALPKTITIDGEKTKISHGYIQGFGVGSDDDENLVSGYGVVLSSAGVTVEEGNFVGSGQLILMDLVSSSSVELASGTYEISDENLKNTAWSIVLKNFDSEVGSENVYEATSGTIKITKSGTTYKIKFNLTMVDDEDNEIQVKGSYEGKLVETQLNIG